jgi:hypothetical protein
LSQKAGSTDKVSIQKRRSCGAKEGVCPKKTVLSAKVIGLAPSGFELPMLAVPCRQNRTLQSHAEEIEGRFRSDTNYSKSGGRSNLAKALARGFTSFAVKPSQGYLPFLSNYVRIHDQV